MTVRSALTRPAMAATVGAAFALALTLTACSASAPASITDAAAPVPSPAADSACSSDYEKGAWSVAIIMENQTGQTLTLDPSRTTRADPGHWAQQAPATLAAGDCAVISAYSDDPAGADFWATATYTLPDGTYVPFSCGTMGSPSGAIGCNQHALWQMPGTSPEDLNNAPPSTFSMYWNVDPSSYSGLVHLRWTVTASPGSLSR